MVGFLVKAVVGGVVMYTVTEVLRKTGAADKIMEGLNEGLTKVEMKMEEMQEQGKPLLPPWDEFWKGFTEGRNPTKEKVSE